MNIMIDPLLLSQTGAPLVFIHANGYPPEAYRRFLEPFLDRYQVEAVYLRPFWPGSDSDQFRDWRDFRDDYLVYLRSRTDLPLPDPTRPSSRPLIGMGHSVGAMTTLMAAIQQPEYFRLLVLIEPVLFTHARGTLMRLIAPLMIMRRIYPLIRGTLKRKTDFQDREAMYQNYRGKSIFKLLSDEVLRDYVSGLAAENPDGTVRLKYSPDWEARIYETAGVADWYVWENLSRVNCPVLVLRGETTDTLLPPVLASMVADLPHGTGINVLGAGHLLPLEKPRQTAGIIVDYLEKQDSG
jgi:pimeloyl-ACP methyl ester carboxylesterase